jgi:hypothetical protein
MPLFGASARNLQFTERDIYIQQSDIYTYVQKKNDLFK